MHNLRSDLIPETIASGIALADNIPAGNDSDSDFGGNPAESKAAPFSGYHFSRAMRLHRLFRHGSRLVIVPLDHSVTDGPIVRRGRSLDQLVADLAASEVDAIVVHKGSLRQIRHTRFSAMSLIIHLLASSHHAPDPDAKYLVTSVEEALSLGADAVSMHVNLGSPDERRQIADLGAVAWSCDKWLGSCGCCLIQPSARSSATRSWPPSCNWASARSRPISRCRCSSRSVNSPAGIARISPAVSARNRLVSGRPYNSGCPASSAIDTVE